MSTSPALDQMRRQLDRALAFASSVSLGRHSALLLALGLARHLDRDGDIEDARRLAGVLTMVVSAEQQRGDLAAVTSFAGELLAVLSDIADDGDEDVACDINIVALGLDGAVLARACAAARDRRDGRLLPGSGPCLPYR